MSKNNNYENLTGLQKASIIMLSLPEGQVEKIMGYLEVEDIKKIVNAMSHLGSISPEVVEKLILDFVNMLKKEGEFIGSKETVEKLILKTISKEKFGDAVEEVLESVGCSTWDKLGRVNIKSIVGYLENENPQIAAIIISRLKSENAAKVLENLPENLAIEIVNRIINMGKVNKDILEEVENSVLQEFFQGKKRKVYHVNHESVAKIFNGFDQNKSSHFLKKLEESDPESSSKLRFMMFIFDDLIRLTDESIRNIIREADKSKLVIVLKDSKKELKDLFLRNVSSRVARFMEDEISALKNVTRIQADEAKNHIMQVAKKLKDEGLIEFVEIDREEEKEAI